MIFYKNLKSIHVPEQDFLDEILSLGKVWFTAKNKNNYELTFVKDKENSGFYLSKLKNFPKITEFVEKNIPNSVVKNSYVTRCDPGYTMEKHIDANRKTALIIPLGNNKGILNFYYKDKIISSCRYKGPTLSRVDVVHSAVNNSDDFRYSISVEVTESYFYNFFKYF